MRRLSLPLAALLVASLGLAGCGGDDSKQAAEPEPTVAFTPAADGGDEDQVEPTTWPLTGLPVDDGDSAVDKHPILVTKIDNTSSSSPQVGLSKADLVVEELVEGGLTRLAVFFYSQVPDNAGPVRSMRASDIGIVPSDHAAVITSGAARVTINRISGAGIPFFQEGAKGIYRDTSRSAPYNLFAHLTEVAKATKHTAVRPADYLPWGDGKDLPQGKKATTFAAAFSGGHRTEWNFDGQGYTNTNSNAGADDQFTADTVLALQVQVGDAGYLDPAGNHVPETHFVGDGTAWMFHNGRVIRGTWHKNKLTSMLTLKGPKGTMTVPAGHVWIELVPAGPGNVTWQK